jgi:hypothetical protein
VDEDTHRILLDNDSTTNWEHPPEFDWAGSMDRVKAFKVDAEQLLGQPLRFFDQVQDASFFAELYVPHERKTSHGTEVRMKIAIRFSNFGGMATVWADRSVSDLNEYPVDRLVRQLTEHGFVPVCADALREVYDGKNDTSWSSARPFTWWLRFFEYD